MTAPSLDQDAAIAAIGDRPVPVDPPGPEVGRRVQGRTMTAPTSDVSAGGIYVGAVEDRAVALMRTDPELFAWVIDLGAEHGGTLVPDAGRR